jgi:Holliday junction DNA helicase RuvA
MYAYLQGRFTKKTPAQIYVDVNGVGYEVNISLNTYSAIQSLEEGRVYTHLQIKEDGHTLFGFFGEEEKEIFLLLISVSGVGASTARMMLSSLKPAEVVSAIAQGNTKLLEGVKGIGKKSAERLVLELKDKVGKQAQSTGTAFFSAQKPIEQDAVVALVALGIAKNQAEAAVQKVLKLEPNTDQLESLIKKALKSI